MIDISVLMPTYGRTKLLEEAIESFIRQDFTGSAELLVLNDCANQYLEIDGYPNIHVINVPNRFETLGDKLNALAAVARGRWLTFWDDDDVILPVCLSEITSHCKGPVEAFHKDCIWVMNKDPLFALSKNLTMQVTTAIRPAVYDRIGRSGHLTVGVDIDLNRRVVQETCVQRLCGEPWYVYRWASTGRPHISGWGGMGRSVDEQRQVDANAHRRFTKEVEDRQLAGSEPQGVILLRPHWKLDYCEMARVSWKVVVDTLGEAPTLQT